MENLLELMRAFEKRNNISIYIDLCSDGSCGVKELWHDGSLNNNISNIKELYEFLKNTNYELSSDGICLSPVIIIK